MVAVGDDIVGVVAEFVMPAMYILLVLFLYRSVYVEMDIRNGSRGLGV